MWNLIINNFAMTAKIIVMVMILLIVIEYIELKYKGIIREKLIERLISQYMIASLPGAVPGFMDTFLLVVRADIVSHVFSCVR